MKINLHDEIKDTKKPVSIWFLFSTDSDNTFIDAKEESREETWDITPGFVKTLPSGNFSHPHPWLPNGRWEEVLLSIRPSPSTGGIHSTDPPREFPALSLVNTISNCFLIGPSQSRMSKQLRKDNAGRTWLITTPTIDCDTDLGKGAGRERMTVAFKLIF